MASMAKLKKLIKEVPEGKRDIAKNIFGELQFMQCTLERLKKQINDEGETSLFKQGKQEFLKEHPALKSYATLIQRYSLLNKQLVDLLPKDTQKEVKDDLMEFIKG